MRLLLDESAEYRLAHWLRDQGHNVTAIAHDYPHALSDRAVLALARQEQRILITNDSDFGELIVRQQLPHAGVIYFRMPAATVATKIERLAVVLRGYADRLDQLLVVTERTIRIRRTRAW